jgi:hypothetical protein
LIPVEALKEAQRGRAVLVVTDTKMQFSESIGDGILFVRGFSLYGLRSVVVDMVYLVGDVPPDAVELASERISGSRIGQVRRYLDPQKGKDA